MTQTFDSICPVLLSQEHIERSLIKQVKQKMIWLN